MLNPHISEPANRIPIDDLFPRLAQDEPEAEDVEETIAAEMLDAFRVDLKTSAKLSRSSTVR